MRTALIILLTATLISGCQWFSSSTPDTFDPTVTAETSQQENPRYYQPYSQDALAQALANDGRAILFFTADWCEACLEAEADILAKGGSLPENVVIFFIDFDTALDLRRNYSVVTEHTFVLLNQQGVVMERWVGGGTDDILIRVSASEPVDLVDDLLQ